MTKRTLYIPLKEIKGNSFIVYEQREFSVYGFGYMIVDGEIKSTSYFVRVPCLPNLEECFIIPELTAKELKKVLPEIFL